MGNDYSCISFCSEIGLEDEMIQMAKTMDSKTATDSLIHHAIKTSNRKILHNILSTPEQSKHFNRDHINKMIESRNWRFFSYCLNYSLIRDRMLERLTNYLCYHVADTDLVMECLERYQVNGSKIFTSAFKNLSECPETFTKMIEKEYYFDYDELKDYYKYYIDEVHISILLGHNYYLSPYLSNVFFLSACHWGNLGVIKMLVKNGFDIQSAATSDSMEGMYQAMNHNRNAVTKYLLQYVSRDDMYKPARNGRSVIQATAFEMSDEIKNILKMKFGTNIMVNPFNPGDIHII